MLGKVKDVNRVMTGVFLSLVALLGFYLARSLSNFTDVGLGPGFAPHVFAGMQLAIGLALIALGFIKAGDRPESWHLRPLLIIVAIVFFGATIETMGMVIALAGLILIACCANKGTKPIEAIGLAAITVLFSAIVFVKLLGLTMPLWPAMMLGN